MKAIRIGDAPLIHRGLHPSLGDNINGPSLIRVPAWLPDPLGRYYLYFAHHNGRHIRMAYADAIEGPWTVYAPGVLSVEDSTCLDHVASPDVHVDDGSREIRLYFHGVAFPKGAPTDGHEQLFGAASRWIGNQRTKLAVSRDGLQFRAQERVLGASYLRAFEWRGRLHAMAMPGVLYRARGDGEGLELGPQLFDASFRHCAVRVDGDRLQVFFTRVGDAPERILHTTVALQGDWSGWSCGPVQEVLRPESAWEGAGLALEPSSRGPVFTPVRQLRDPALFVEDGRCYLLYAGGGEQAIGLAELVADG
ncbi:MAG TPA: hypothetical protein VEA40_22620 [Ramlibacter sp.]|nr:hypothetical protein [Ramlibacter sp.]